MKNKDASSSFSLMNIVAPGDKKGNTFSELLKGMTLKKGLKDMDDAPLVLSLQGAQKDTKTLKQGENAFKLELFLQGSDAQEAQDDTDIEELNPKLLGILGKDEMKNLINDAKNYLKEQILESEGYKRAETKELPKTLGGLIETAKKFGIDINKVSIEEIKSDFRGELPKQELAQDKKSLHVKEESLIKESAQDKKSLHVKEESLIKESAQDKKSLHVKEEPLIKESAQDKKSPQNTSEKHSSALTNQAQNERAYYQNETIDNEKALKAQKETAQTPLFKAQSPVQEHASTQQIVQAKANNLLKSEDKTQKTKADETLKLLLREDKSSVSNSSLTSDFSVATAKVIAPELDRDSAKGLEKLLRDDSTAPLTEGLETAKTESAGVSKADSFEVKLNEAKQMIKYLSSDIKTAIEDYKPPFTRVKVQLNPAHLGEVDLTVVQRGKNLHVNISSNNAAMNTLLVNANELRTQLNNNGINNATLNFSDSSQNGQNAADSRGQQHRQNQQQAHQEYNYFDSEDTHEEIISSLEIVVPRYI